MKKLINLILIIICSTGVFAQFKLSGKINNYTGNGELKINIPLVYGYQEQNSIKVPIAKNGTFAIVLPLKKQKLGDLIFQKNFHQLLFNPNKNLVVELAGDGKAIKLLKGTALPENKVLQSVNLEEYPFFLQNSEAYVRLDLAAINAQVVKPYFAMRDKKMAMVNQSALAIKDKNLIASEIKYVTYNNLYELVDLGTGNKNTIDQVMAALFTKSSIKPDMFPAGPYYYIFVTHYLDYAETKAFSEVRQDKIKPNRPIPNLGIGLDSVNIITAKYGKPYLRWVEWVRSLPDNVTEQLAYQQIVRLVYDKNRPQTEVLAKLFIKRFPASTYNADIRKRMNTLKR